MAAVVGTVTCPNGTGRYFAGKVMIMNYCYLLLPTIVAFKTLIHLASQYISDNIIIVCYISEEELAFIHSYDSLKCYLK